MIFAFRSLLVFIFLGLILRATPLEAATCQGLSFAEELKLGDQTLVLNGLGIRRALGFVKVYVAGLYLEKKTKEPRDVIEGDKPRAITLKLLRNVDKGDMVGAWTKGFQDNAPDLWPAIEPRIAAMSSLVRSMKEGETITMAYRPGVGTEFIIAGASGGKMEGADFARALFSIYAGPKPPNAGLKTGVLGGACD